MQAFKNFIYRVVVASLGALIGGILLAFMTYLLFPNLVPDQYIPSAFTTFTSTPTPNPPTAMLEPTATPTAEPPTATPLPTASPTPVVDFPSLNARVVALRFYESGYDALPRAERVYARSFASDTSRYINWELNLEYPAPGRRIDFQIMAIYYQDNGTSWEEIHRHTLDAHVEEDRTGSYRGWGYGDRYPGNWETGIYRVDLYVAGKKIASEQFLIYTSPPSPTATPNATLTPPEPYIPSLNARVTVFWFYEWGNAFLWNQQHFDSNTTRYIGWGLNLEYPAPGRRIEFEITHIWFQQKGTSWEEIFQGVDTSDVKADSTISTHLGHIGDDNPGNWETGVYKVDLYVEGKKIASDQFEIY